MSADAITPRAVRIALRQLWSDRTPADGPLADLVLVSRLLDRHGSPVTRSSRQWALGQVLCETVEAELARRRAGGAAEDGPFSEPPTARRGADPSAALERVRLDFSTDDAALEGCSAVYHLYLRPDLGLSTSRLAALVSGRHPRTVQRRLGLGLDIIAHRLRLLEAGAAAEHRRTQLRHRLPSPNGGQLFGVDRIHAQLRTWWADNRHSPVLVLTGPGGSGKSTVAAALLRQLLDAETKAHAAWLRACDRRRRPVPGGAGVIDDAGIVDRPLARPTLREEAPAGRWSTAVATEDLRDARAARPDAIASPIGGAAAAGRSVLAAGRALGSTGDALIVVDGVDDAREMWAVARAIARVGAGPRWLITSRLGWGAFQTAQTVPMPALDPTAALALLRHECRRRALYGVAAASDHALDSLVAAAAGHPAAILLAASELRAAPVDTVAERLRAGAGRAGDLYARLWSGAWRAAPPAVRRVVDVVAGLERAGRVADPEAIAAAGGWTGDDLEAALRAGLDLGLLAVGDDERVCFRTPLFLATWRAGG
ncbi:MAG: ATP-binding protein [Ardenticatenales bacterium]|nr:ATP-binding protein [Ardenticatenales bacterium]